MAAPTEDQMIAHYKNECMFLEKAYQVFSTDSGSLRSRLEDIRNNANSAADYDWKGDSVKNIDRTFAQLGAIISPAGAAQRLTPVLRGLAKAVDFSETDPLAILDRLYTRWNGVRTVKTRAVVPPTASQSLTGTGNGTVRILTTDAYGFAKESGFSETVYAEVTKDQGDVYAHEEELSLRGGDADPRFIQVLGSGGQTSLRAVSARQGNGQTLLRNGSFEYIGTAGSATGLTDWTLAGTGSTTWAQDTTNYYRTFQGATPASFRANATMTMSQALDKIGRGKLTGLPFWFGGRYNRTVGTATGSLVIRAGAVSATVADLSTGSGWQEIALTLGTNNWWKSAYENGFDISIEPTISGGYLLLDDFILAVMTPFGLGWYICIGGTTPFKRTDYGSWAFTETRPVVQFWTQRAFGKYFPHDAAPSITDPS